MPSNTLDIPRSGVTGPLRSKAQGGLAMLKAYAALASGRVAPNRIFGHLNDDVWWAVNTTAYRRFEVLRKVLPSLPDDEVQVRFIGNAGDTALSEGFRFYQLVRAIASREDHPVTDKSTVLDFGCGWGRMLRFFMRDVPLEQLYGVDVMSQAIELCRKTNPWANFAFVPPLPPSQLPSAHFDLVYLYSVFSHLSEEAHNRWLEEFHRILKPGGLLFATTWQRQYIESCASARRGDTAGTHPGSLGAFVDTEQWLARYDAGEFCHSAVGGGDELAEDFYGESCIPEAYVRSRWANRFETVDYIEADGAWLWQNLIVARRK